MKRQNPYTFEERFYQFLIRNAAATITVIAGLAAYALFGSISPQYAGPLAIKIAAFYIPLAIGMQMFLSDEGKQRTQMQSSKSCLFTVKFWFILGIVASTSIALCHLLTHSAMLGRIFVEGNNTGVDPDTYGTVLLFPVVFTAFVQTGMLKITVYVCRAIKILGILTLGGLSGYLLVCFLGILVPAETFPILIPAFVMLGIVSAACRIFLPMFGTVKERQLSGEQMLIETEYFEVD